MSVHTQFINPDRAKDFLTQADILAKQKQYQGAIEALREVFKFQPNNYDGHILAARIYIKVGKTETAKDILADLEKHTSATEESLLLKAKVALATGSHAECEKVLTDIFSNRRDHSEALMVLADLYYTLGRHSESIGIYERLHEKDKSNLDLVYSLALGYFEIRDYNECLFYCSHLLNVEKRNRSVNALYQRALREAKKDFLAKKGKATFLDRLRLLIHDPYTAEQIKIHSEMERKTQRASRQTYIDANTDALNYKAMLEYIPSYLMASKTDFFLCQMDVDFFKAFNDFYSHQIGDVVLRALAHMGGIAFPQKFFRKGGEEFVWVFEGEEEDAINKARSFRERIEKYATQEANNLIVNHQIKTSTGDLYHVERNITVSQGLAKYQQDGRNLNELLESADAGLLKAKASGRNAVCYMGSVVDQGEKPEKPILDGR